MSNTRIIANKSDIVAIADAIRNRINSTDEMSYDDIISKINEIGGEGTNETFVLQNKTVTPSTNNQVVGADEGYNGLESVTVVGDTDLIPENIVSGKNIFGVSGSYQGIDWTSGGSHTVESVSGASYGFALNSNGYYESQNKGKDGTAAVCKISFYSDGNASLILECINYAESNYDYGLLSNIDTTLTTSNTADSSGVFKNFKGSSSASVVTVNYGTVSAGTHFIYVKFRKDGSDKSGNDSLQFKVVSPTSIKSEIVNAIENKGVDVPSNVELDDVAGLIDSISSASSSGNIGLAKGAITSSMWNITAGTSIPYSGVMYEVSFISPIEVDKLVNAVVFYKYNNYQTAFYFYRINDTFHLYSDGLADIGLSAFSGSAIITDSNRNGTILSFSVMAEDNFNNVEILSHDPGYPNYITSYYEYLGDINDSVDVVGPSAPDTGTDF